MKNLKKMKRNELKTITGGNILTDIGDKIKEVTNNAINEVKDGLCNVECLINGVVHIKLLDCGSTC